MEWKEPHRSRLILLLLFVVIFSLSAITSWRLLAICWAFALLIFFRGCCRNLWLVSRLVLPLTIFFAGTSWLYLRFSRPALVEIAPWASLILRPTLIAFIIFSGLKRIDLFRALSAPPLMTRLFVLTLAQIHALRRLVSDARLGLSSRLLQRPSAKIVLSNASGVTASLFTIAGKNAAEASEALRSRGWS